MRNFATRRNRVARLVISGLLLGLLLPYGLLVWQSLGSGWTFPNLRPTRMDLAPWKSLVASRGQLLRSLLISIELSLLVGVTATICGLLIGRSLRMLRSPVWRFLVYLPFVISPVIAATSLLDLLIRVRMQGTVAGVFVCQLVFATSFAAVFFRETWSPRTDRLESLVRGFGGRTRDVWRHVVLTECRGLMLVCFIQTSLYSWLDYGLVSVIGGGHVPTLTTQLFMYIREASVNQAAMASVVLLTPALLGFILISLSRSVGNLRTRTVLVES